MTTDTQTAPEQATLTQNEAAEYMTMWWDTTLWLPFVESENCDITGPGHQDPKAFARAVTHYDRTASADPKATKTDPADVKHRWILAKHLGDPDQWWAQAVPANTPGAIPVTTIWGVR